MIGTKELNENKLIDLNVNKLSEEKRLALLDWLLDPSPIDDQVYQSFFE